MGLRLDSLSAMYSCLDVTFAISSSLRESFPESRLTGRTDPAPTCSEPFPPVAGLLRASIFREGLPESWVERKELELRVPPAQASILE